MKLHIYIGGLWEQSHMVFRISFCKVHRNKHIDVIFQLIKINVESCITICLVDWFFVKRLIIYVKWWCVDFKFSFFLISYIRNPYLNTLLIFFYVPNVDLYLLSLPKFSLLKYQIRTTSMYQQKKKKKEVYSMYIPYVKIYLQNLIFEILLIFHSYSFGVFSKIRFFIYNQIPNHSFIFSYRSRSVNIGIPTRIPVTWGGSLVKETGKTERELGSFSRREKSMDTQTPVRSGDGGID